METLRRETRMWATVCPEAVVVVVAVTVVVEVGATVRVAGVPVALVVSGSLPSQAGRRATSRRPRRPGVGIDIIGLPMVTSCTAELGPPEQPDRVRRRETQPTVGRGSESTCLVPPKDASPIIPCGQSDLPDQRL